MKGKKNWKQEQMVAAYHIAMEEKNISKAARIHGVSKPTLSAICNNKRPLYPVLNTQLTKDKGQGGQAGQLDPHKKQERLRCHTTRTPVHSAAHPKQRETTDYVQR